MDVPLFFFSYTTYEIAIMTVLPFLPTRKTMWSYNDGAKSSLILVFQKKFNHQPELSKD